MKGAVVIVVCMAILSAGFTGILLNRPEVIRYEDPEKVDPLLSRVDPKANLNFDGEIDLEDDAQVTIYGENGGSPKGDAFGHFMAMGDINNDGFNELFITGINAPVNITAEPDEFGPGHVFVYFGRNRSELPNSFDLTEVPPDIIIKGVYKETQFGDSIVISNINDDEYNDILISAPNNNNTNAGLVGKVYVIYGKPKDQFAPVIDMLYDYDVRLKPGSESASYMSRLSPQFGRGLGCTDFDGDGIQDVIISAPSNRSINILWGAPVLVKDQVPPIRIVLSEDKLWLGEIMCVGDINNDGYGDIVVGSGIQDNMDGDIRAGRLYIIFGRPRTHIEDPTMTPDARGYNNPDGLEYFWWFNEMWNVSIHGNQEDDNFGDNIALGDFNGDGFKDIFVSAPGGDGWQDTITDCGETYLIWGNDNRNLGFGPWGAYNPRKIWNISEMKEMTIYGASPGDRAGYKGYMGDIDQDGFEDLIFSAPHADGPSGSKEDCGESYLLFGFDPVKKMELNISEKEVDLIVYGVTREDHLGSAVTTGDLDQDGFVDIILSSSIANGPGEMRKNCGEVYIIFASGFRTKEFGLIGGYDPDTRTEGKGKICFADHKDYQFFVTISDSSGISDLDEVDLVLDPEGEDILIRWEQQTGLFSEVSDPNDIFYLNISKCTTEVNNNNITIYFGGSFGWAYPSDILQGARILIRNDSAYHVRSTFTERFIVENDLDLIGPLDVQSSIVGDLNVNGSFCPMEGLLNWTGLKVVYQETLDICPPDHAFDVRINDGVSSWYDNTSQGENIEITTGHPYSTADKKGVKYEFDIISRLGDSEDVSNHYHYLRTDTAPPPMPENLIVYPDDLHGAAGTLDNDNTVFVQWDPIVDITTEASTQDGAGIKRYFVSTEDGSGTTVGQETWDSGGLWGDYYDSDNFADLAFSKLDPELSIDWGYWSPHDTLLSKDNFSVRWTGKLLAPQTDTYTLYITTDDGAKIWIDGKLIYDEWRLGHGKQVLQYMDAGQHDIRIEFRDKVTTAKFEMDWSFGTQERQLIPMANLLHPASWAKVGNLSEGENTIYVWAEDRFGNIGPAGNTTVVIDTEGPEFKDQTMKDGWYTRNNIQLGITVFDEIAGVSDDIEYRLSENGKNGYTDWEVVAVGILDWDNPNNSVAFKFNSVFSDGGDNYIQFQAKDQLGNGYSQSQEYNILVDTVPIEIKLNNPENNSVHYKDRLAFNLSVDDTSGSGVDISKVQYRFSTNGTGSYSTWFNIPSENITLKGNDRHANVELGVTFAEGSMNWIQFRAQDIAGNGFVETPQYHFTIQYPVINKRPVAVIAKPTMNATFVRGDTIEFSAEGTTDDGNIQPLTYTWLSNWDGQIGMGKTLDYSKPLFIGEHVVTLKVYDGYYNVSVSVKINILDDNDPTRPVNPENPDDLNDTDHDGMLDSWEEEFFGSIDGSDGTGDSDGDGYTDRLEYLYDSDPKDDKDMPPSVIPPDTERAGETESSSYLWLIALVIVLLIIIGGTIFFLYLRKKQQEDQLKGDTQLHMREKTKSDIEEEGRIIDDEYDVSIEKRSKKQKNKEAKKLYGKSKKGKSKRKMKHDDEDDIIMPGENIPKEPVNDPFAEGEFDMDTVDDDLFDDDYDDEDDILDEPEDDFDEPDEDDPLEEEEDPFDENDDLFDEEGDDEDWEDADWEEDE